MSESLRNDDKSIRSYILNDVFEKVPIDKSYEKLYKVIGLDAIAFYDFQYWYYRFKDGKHDLDFDRNSEPQPLQFSDLPLDAVGLIVDKLELLDKFMLKKVSKPLQDFIEQQEITCTSIKVVCYRESASLELDREKIISYRNYLPNSEWFVRNHRYVKADNVESAIFNDLAWILKNRNLQLDYFTFESQLETSYKEITEEQEKLRKNCYNKLENVLKSSPKHQIAVKKVGIHAKNMDNILAILPYLKPGYLEEIEIRRCEFTKKADNSQKIKKIMSLDQWKQADKLDLRSSLDLFPEEVYTQFKNYNIEAQWLNRRSLMYFIKMFSTSLKFERCHFLLEEVDEYVDSDEEDQIGVPGPANHIRHYFIPNSNDYFVVTDFNGMQFEVQKTRHVQ